MKNPCFEHQATDTPDYDPDKEKAYWDNGKMVVTPQVSKAFYKEAKAWSDRGYSYPEILDQMARVHGLRKQTIAGILRADKVASRMSNDAWYKQAKYREIKTAAEHMVANANLPGWVNKAGYIYNISRAVATVWHGGVIPFSHAFNMLLSGRLAETKIWLNAVKNAYRYGQWPVRRGGAGEAAWAKDMEEMVGTEKWIDAVRHGVEAHPADAPVGILRNLAEGWGVRAFDALKIARVDLFELRKAQLKEFDDQSLRMLGNEVNIATGTMKMGEQTGRLLALGQFAPKVWITKRMQAFTPIRYGLKMGRMTQNERAVMNQSLGTWARHAAIAMALMETSDMFNKYFLKNNDRVNKFDFMNPGTLWRVNWGKHVIPISPLVEVLRAPVAAMAMFFLNRRELHGETPSGAAGEILWREVKNSLHPTIINMMELMQGREEFGVPRHEQRLPFPGVKQLFRGEDPQERDAPLTWTQYALERSAIPVADFAKEIFSPALVDETGIPKSQADKLVWAFAASGLSGLMGKHTFEVSPKAAPQKTRHKAPLGSIKNPVIRHPTFD